jgi:hypothetical protein
MYMQKKIRFFQEKLRTRILYGCAVWKAGTGSLLHNREGGRRGILKSSNESQVMGTV